MVLRSPGGSAAAGPCVLSMATPWGLHSRNSDVKLCLLARRVESTSYGVHDLLIVAWRDDGPRRLLSA